MSEKRSSDAAEQAAKKHKPDETSGLETSKVLADAGGEYPQIDLDLLTSGSTLFPTLIGYTKTDPLQLGSAGAGEDGDDGAYGTLLDGRDGKPQHGTEEWYRVRRDNHKEVERRRRENINQGIRDIAALMPFHDNNKLAILQRAVEYIKRLKENENNNIEKWTLEKLLTDQAVGELSTSNEKLKRELEKAYKELEHWKRLYKEKAGE